VTDKLNTLLGYDTILFDLDHTVWTALNNTGQAISVARTTPPYELTDQDTVQDSKDNVIRLQDGIRKLMQVLNKNGIALGIVTKSGDSNTPFSAQPGVMLLKAFDLYKYLNDAFVVVLGHPEKIDKDDYVRGDGKTLLIDDDLANLKEVNERALADILNRNAFISWNDFFEEEMEQPPVAPQTSKQLSRLAQGGQVWEFSDGQRAKVAAVDCDNSIVWLRTKDGGSLYVDTAATEPHGRIRIFSSEQELMDYNDTRNLWFVNEPPPTGEEELDLPMHGQFYTDWRLKDKQRKEKETLYDPTRENLQLWTREKSKLVFGYEPRVDETPSMERTPEEVNFSVPYTDVQLKRKKPRYDIRRDWFNGPGEDRPHDSPESNRFDYAIV
jgi:predicted phosphatase